MIDQDEAARLAREGDKRSREKLGLRGGLRRGTVGTTGPGVQLVGSWCGELLETAAAVGTGGGGGAREARVCAQWALMLMRE